MLHFPFFPGTNLQDLNLDWIINFVKMIPSRLPKFSDHHTWLVYDYSTGEFYDSGEPTGGAGEPGKSPIIGANGNWYTWNNSTSTYTDTGTKAQGAGVAAGGVAGDVLIKTSGADYNTGWTATPPQMGSLAPIESNPALLAHAVGDCIVYNGQLYVVTTAIAPGNAITDKISPVTVVSTINNARRVIKTTLTLTANPSVQPYTYYGGFNVYPLLQTGEAVIGALANDATGRPTPCAVNADLNFVTVVGLEATVDVIVTIAKNITVTEV